MKTFRIEMSDGGVMAGELYPDIAPKTVENFEKIVVLRCRLLNKKL